MLALVAGRVPLLIEIKDQDGALRPECRPARGGRRRVLSTGYTGPIAVMSFNPHSVAAMGRRGARRAARPDHLRAIAAENWPAVPNDTRGAAARRSPISTRVGASFISHDGRDLAAPRVAALKARGVPVLCWTIRSPGAETQARRIADSITFEGYAAQRAA